MISSVRQLLALVFVQALPSMFAAAGGPPPITVEQPVSVQGIVEVINDVLRKPYIVRSVTAQGPVFDIPDGKRLVIEMITFEVEVEGDTIPRVVLDIARPGQPSAIVLPLAAQFSGEVGTRKIYIGTLPFKARLDSIPGSTAEARIYARNTNGNWNGVVLGYLVDL